MPVTVAFIETRNVTDPEGAVSMIDEWSGTRSEDGGTVTLTFPTGTIQANVQTAIEGWFTANFPLPGPQPAPSTEVLVSLTGRFDTATGVMELLDTENRPWASTSRDASGNADLQIVDTNGNKRRVLTPQAGQIRVAAGVTEAVAIFEQPFAENEKPTVAVTSEDPLGNMKTALRKNAANEWDRVEVALETAPTVTQQIHFAAVPRRKV